MTANFTSALSAAHVLANPFMGHAWVKGYTVFKVTKLVFMIIDQCSRVIFAGCLPYGVLRLYPECSNLIGQ